jgi:hypothetical protein
MATDSQSTGPNKAKAATVTSPHTAEVTCLSEFSRAIVSSRIRPRQASSMTPNAAPKYPP